MEFIRETEGVRFYNDSKATNVDATKKALESMEGNVVLIAGGKDKGGSYGFITPSRRQNKGSRPDRRGEGEDRGELGPYVATYAEEDLAEAVERAFGWQEEETRCSSPPCARASTCSRTTRPGETHSDRPWRPCEKGDRPRYLMPFLFLPLPRHDRREDVRARLAMASAYGMSRLHPRYLLASKYPLIGLCLALSPVLVIYPA